MTRAGPDIFSAYLSGAARAFFTMHFAAAADRARAVRQAQRPLANEVLAALTAQNARYGESVARARHLAALREGARVVVSGQQAGLFLGPLYTVYKAASAVAVARALASETGTDVVPVFWLQSEDHDLPEIAACHVLSPTGPSHVHVPVTGDERISVAHRTLPQEVTQCLAFLRDTLSHLPHAEAHLARLRRHYRPGAGWVEAFAWVLAELFEPHGLLLLDPRDSALAPMAAAVHRRAIDQAEPIARALETRATALVGAGFAATVHVRPGAPLSYFHPQGPTGPRVRITCNGDGSFAEVGTGVAHPRAHVLDRLAREPLCFSTSALLRPILQDTLLPTAAYVGGPAEVAYFAQLGPVYEAYDLPMPLVVPRARLRVLEDKTERLLARLNLPADAVEDSEAALLARVRAPAPGVPAPETLEGSLMAAFDQALTAWRAALVAAGQGLDTAVEKTRANVHAAVSKLSNKYASALSHADQGLVDDVRRLRAWLYPHDQPQERCYGLAYFAARYSEEAFIEKVLATIEPFAGSRKDLRP